MHYNNIFPAKFLSRPNRFIAEIEVFGRKEICHVKNTGRCRELLVPGVDIYVQKSDNQERKTAYDLISVYKNNVLFNIDSVAPNKVFSESAKDIFEDLTFIKSEVKHLNSRFDFYMERGEKKCFVEVKGVTLEIDKKALFPDAPTQRGIKHLEELSECVNEGYEAYVVFVLAFKGATSFSPNVDTHPQFADALVRAKERGVNIIAYDCRVSADSLTIDKPVKIIL